MNVELSYLYDFSRRFELPGPVKHKPVPLTWFQRGMLRYQLITMFTFTGYWQSTYFLNTEW